MDTTNLAAEPRTDFGKGAARKLRAAGRLPALAYRAGGEPVHFTLDPREVSLAYQRAGNPNLLISVDVGGKPLTLLLKDTQKHPVSRQLLHLDFFEVLADEKVTVGVPVRTVGKAAGERLGGRIRILRPTVDIVCLPADIPATLDVDVTALEVDDMVDVNELTAPEGCEIVFKHRYKVVTLVGKRAAAADEAEAEAEAAEEAEES